MKFEREYKSDIEGIGTLVIGVDNKNNWFAEIKGGAKFIPMLTSTDPIWIENRKWSTALPEKFGISSDLWNQIRGEIRTAEESSDQDREDDNEEKYPTEIIKEAKRIMTEEDAIDFLMRQYHKNHRGDPMIGMGWFCSFASGQSLTSNGIQPAAHSEDPGMGKTDSAKAAFHCIHTRRDLETSVSAMSLYRDKSLKPGDIISSDDVEWTTGLTSTVKRAMSNFQTLTWHTTLDNNNELAKYSLPPRLLWWFTSVESASHDQLVDRQFLFDVDDSIDHHEAVNEDIQKRRATACLKFATDDEILIARAITKLIKKNGPFVVEIPFSKWINWKLPKSHRDLNKFYDLIDAFAILRFNHRGPVKQDDGSTRIKATIDDYRCAKKIFASRQKNIRTHLTDSETRLLNIMVGQSDWSQSELVERSGMKQGTISKRLTALLEKSNYIKSWKVAGGETRYAVTDKVDISLFANAVVDLDPIPTGRSFIGPGYEKSYSWLFRSYSTLIPLLFLPIPIGGDIMEYGYSILERDPQEKKKGYKLEDKENKEVNILKNSESGNKEEKFSFGGGGSKSGISSQNQQQATHSGWNKCGISVEYDRNKGRIPASSDHIHLQDFISEMERKTRGIKVSEVVDMGHDELAVLETLDKRGWTEGRGGFWSPPRRTR